MARVPRIALDASWYELIFLDLLTRRCLRFFSPACGPSHFHGRLLFDLLPLPPPPPQPPVCYERAALGHHIKIAHRSLVYFHPVFNYLRYQVMILNGQVPHLTGFGRAVFAPGVEVETHSHKSMDEVFYGQEGKGIIEVDGTVVQVMNLTHTHANTCTITSNGVGRLL